MPKLPDHPATPPLIEVRIGDLHVIIQRLPVPLLTFLTLSARPLPALLAGLTPENHRLAVALASVPEHIRGFGHVKDTHLEKAKAREADLLAQFRDPAPAPEKVAAE